jgi:prophage regulatory protein
MTNLKKISRLVQRREAERICGFKQTMMWERERTGLFPPRIAMSARMNVWLEDELFAVNAAVIAGKADDEIRELVKRMVAARKNMVNLHAHPET